MPWPIEKESALNLYLSNESIPSVLKVRTYRNIKYSLSIPYSLKIQIRPNATFHEKTRQYFEIWKTRLFLDIPEKVLFSIQNRNGINFMAFIRGIKFDKRTLEILYSSNPKPIVAKELNNLAKKCKRNDLAITLEGLVLTLTG